MTMKFILSALLVVLLAACGGEASMQFQTTDTTPGSGAEATSGRRVTVHYTGWLYDAAKAGRIPCVRLGGPDGPVRFRACELEAWIEGSRLAPPDPGTVTRTEDTPAPASRRVEDAEGAQLRFSSGGSS